MPAIIPVRPVARNRILAFISGKLAAVDSIYDMAPRRKKVSPILWASHDIDGLKIIIAFCGAGLLVSLLFVTYGVDLSLGFF